MTLRGKFVGVDYTGYDMAGADLRESIFDACLFDHANMSGVDCTGSDFRNSSFEGTNLNRANFRDAVMPNTHFNPSDCYGMTVTMNCKTFENTRMGQLWWFMWLMMLVPALPVALPVTENLRDALITFIGSVRYLRLKSLLERRNF